MKIALLIVLSWFITGFGLLQAFWPINDRETSTAHRVIWLSIAAGIIGFLWWRLL